MLFSSPIFFGFFSLYYALHLLIPHQWKLQLLILGSTLFYSYWDPYYTWVPFLLIGIAFFGAQWIEQDTCNIEGNIRNEDGNTRNEAGNTRYDEGNTRKFKTIAVILLLLAPLITFKYSNFFYSILNSESTDLWKFALPLGISFVSFSLISYVVEVYQKKFPVEKNITTFTAYTLFFPHLIAGPILRPNELIPQLINFGKRIRFKQAQFGFALFTLGLFKKLVIADPLAAVVDPIYSGAGTAMNTSSGLLFSAYDYWLAIYGFSVQIYCDFSGYTDMALGVALFFGIRLPNNFNKPYLATSMIDFWRRWHITLSNWLRDYIYIPLGGSRKGLHFQIRNIVITMILGGFWHGANWTFLVWGLGHGGVIAINHWMRKWVVRVPKIVKIIVVFHVVTLLWVLFRAPDFETACQIISGPLNASYSGANAFIALSLYPILLIAFFMLFQKWDDHRLIYVWIQKRFANLLWPVLFLIWLISITVSMGSSAKFVYFDF